MSHCEWRPIEEMALGIWQSQYDEAGYPQLGPIKMENRRWGVHDDFVLQAIVAAIAVTLPPEES